MQMQFSSRVTSCAYVNLVKLVKDRLCSSVLFVFCISRIDPYSFMCTFCSSRLEAQPLKYVLQLFEIYVYFLQF
ncbi:hypothetical protein VNO78_32976 [Psophocarpus tetragonolobus]|uniref:Kazal-like domain-containing protein n=1 Tax=Psophocarpus tetragonolobus TaxID=3891 RepID=A0AAN9RKY5_PSOTE